MPAHDAIQRVLVTGSRGYIGSVACPALTTNGFDVTGLDAGWYDDRLLLPREESHRTLHLDVRDVEASHLEGIDAIVHLAALSNDPLGAIDASLTHAINHDATVRLAEMARKAGVKRFIFSGSCSVYGAAGRELLDETAPLAPQTAYAESKVNAERDLLDLATGAFSVVSLRNATAFGISPNQRFDIVLPNLAGSAWVYREVRLLSDGTPWRPLVHIRDITQAIACCLQCPAEALGAQVFNVGRLQANHQIRDIAQAIHERFPGNPPLHMPDSAGPDHRTYLVSFEAIHKSLPGFAAEISMRDGIDECQRVFQTIGLDEETLKATTFTRLARIKELIATGRITDQLRWRSPRTVAA